MPTPAERKEILRAHRWNCRTLADRLGVAPSTVWRAVRHGRGSQELHARITALVGVDLFDLADSSLEIPAAADVAP